MPQSQAALTFAQWGTPPETVPHSPPWWYQSTCPLRRKRPFAAYTRLIRALQRVTISLSRACLFPPLQGSPAFLLPASGCWATTFLCTAQGVSCCVIHKASMLPARIMAPPWVGSQDRVMGHTELRLTGVLRS